MLIQELAMHYSIDFYKLPKWMKDTIDGYYAWRKNGPGIRCQYDYDFFIMDAINYILREMRVLGPKDERIYA